MPELFNEEVAVLGGGLNGEGALARPLDTDVGAGGEALLLALLIVLVVQLLAVRWRNSVFRCNTNISIPCVALVDSALGVGTSGLSLTNKVVNVVVVHGRVRIMSISKAIIQV